MIKKGSIVTILFVISTAIQLVSQIVTTRLFGAKIDLDIFLAAVALPTILVTIIYSTFNDVFLTVYGEMLVKNKKESDNYFITHVASLTFISAIFTVVFYFFSTSITDLLYHERGVVFIQAVATQMNYMMLAIPLSILATLCGSYYYARKDFLRFPLSQVVGTLVNILLIILLQPMLGIWSLIVAFVLNIVAQILIVIPNKISSYQFVKIDLGKFFFLSIPLIIGALATRTDALLIRSLGSSLPEGYLVYLNLISKIMTLAPSVMTIGIQVLLLPHLVEYFAEKNYKKAITTVNRAKLAAIGVSVIVTTGLVLLGPFFIHLLFVGGRFTEVDAARTNSLLPLFILPAVAWGVNSIFFQPLIALRKNLPLTYVQLASAAGGWIVGYIVKMQYGSFAGITCGLIVMLFAGIIGSEILWQIYKKKLLS